MPNDHKAISCETCHGPGLEHILSTDSLLPVRIPSGREFCGLCHAENAARKAGNVKQVNLADHNTGQECTECHNPHDPWLTIR